MQLEPARERLLYDTDRRLWAFSKVLQHGTKDDRLFAWARLTEAERDQLNAIYKAQVDENAAQGDMFASPPT